MAHQIKRGLTMRFRSLLAALCIATLLANTAFAKDDLERVLNKLFA